MLEAQQRAAGKMHESAVWMDTYEPAAAYHPSVRLLTQKYEPWVINMVESVNYHLENKTFILSAKYGTIPYFI